MIQGVLFGQEMAKLAADKAGEEWKKQALESFINYAKANKEFMTEDVRLNSDIGVPPDKRAWGHIAVAAKKQGVITKIGFRYSTDAASHPTPMSLWQSLIYEGDA